MTRIAWLSPLPPQRSGIADYSAALLPHIAARVSVDVYCEGSPDSVPGVRVVRPTRRAIGRLDGYDGVVAHIGNSDLHLWIADAVRRVPTTVVLHEYVIHHMVAALTIGRGDTDGYLDLMQDESGRIGRLLGHAVVDGLSAPLWERAADRFPLTGAVLEQATSVVCHSRFVAAEVSRRFPEIPVSVVAMHAPAANNTPAERPAGAGFVVGAFGFITPNKRLPELMRAVSRLSQDIPGAHLLVVGEAPANINPLSLAAAAGLRPEQVTVVGYADAARFDALLRGCDVLVNLRHPTLGETSATVVSALALGVPTVVSTGGWYDELPDDAVGRVPPGEGEVGLLAALLERLATDPALRERMTIAARRYVRLRLNPGECADAYLRAALAPGGRDAIQNQLMCRLGEDIDSLLPTKSRSRNLLTDRLAATLLETGLAKKRRRLRR